MNEKIPESHGPHSLEHTPSASHLKAPTNARMTKHLCHLPSPAGAAALPLFSFPDQCLCRCLHWRYPLCHLQFALQPSPVWLLSSPLPPSKFSPQGHPDLPVAKCRSRGHLPVLRPYLVTPDPPSGKSVFFGVLWLDIAVLPLGCSSSSAAL